MTFKRVRIHLKFICLLLILIVFNTTSIVNEEPELVKIVVNAKTTDWNIINANSDKTLLQISRFEPELELEFSGNLRGFRIIITNIGKEVLDGKLYVIVYVDAPYLYKGLVSYEQVSYPNPSESENIQTRRVIGFGPARIDVGLEYNGNMILSGETFGFLVVLPVLVYSLRLP